MKKVILTLVAIVAVTFAVNAQVAPVAGNWGVGLNLPTIGIGVPATSPFGEGGDSFTYYLTGWKSGLGTQANNKHNIFGKYYFADNIAGRVTFGINSATGKVSASGDSTHNSEAGTYTLETKTSQFGFDLGLGVEYHFDTDANKLDPYVGAEITIGMLGKKKYTEDFAFTDTSTVTGSTIFNETTSIEKNTTGGFSFAFDALVGFNWFPFNNFNMGVGAEYKIGFMTKSTGGDFDETKNSTYTNGTVGGTSTSTPDNTNTSGSDKNTNSGLHTTVGNVGVNIFFFW